MCLRLWATAKGAVHGDHVSDAIEPETEAAVQRDERRWQTTEGSDGCVHAEVNHYPQHDTQKRRALESGNGLKLLTGNHSHWLCGTEVYLLNIGEICSCTRIPKIMGMLHSQPTLGGAPQGFR